MFLFLILFTILQQCILYPQDFPQNRTNLLGWGNKKKENRGVISFFCSRDEGIRTLDLCNVTAAL